MRIRFWGVQGSCPLFPAANEVAEYTRMVGEDVIRRMLADVQQHSANGKGCTADELLGGAIDNQNVLAYQARLGMAELPVYGGDTTCLSVETPEGDLLILDGGSGIRNCSKFFALNWPSDRAREVHLFGTHEHLDHRSGLPFCQFCYARPPFTMHVYGGYQFLHALDERYGIFTQQINSSTHLDDPIDYRAMSAKFVAHELRNSQRIDYDLSQTKPPWEVRDAAHPLRIGQTVIKTFDVYHGTVRCLAFKIQHGSATFVFCTDHEVRHGADASDPRQAQSARDDQRLAENCQDADAVYVDGQYFRAEYDGLNGIGPTLPVSRVDWGHGCLEDIVERAKKCRVRRTFVGHHDPERTWVERLNVDKWLQQQSADQPFLIELAKSEGILDL
jgi:phosphoribosyl 1,2-cyclic phosphodiesterase